MSIDTNKQIVGRFFDAIGAGAFDDAFAMMADDATWWFPTDALGGLTLDKATMRGTIDTFGKVFKTEPKMERGRMTAEGDRVCLEQQSRGGETHGGATYGNDYHMLITVREGMITEVREYMNPLMSAAIVAEMQAAG